MRISILIVLLSMLLEARWSESTIMRYNFSVHTICKNGYLTDVITGKKNDVEIHYEHSHCVDVSSWDKTQCNHLPISCKNDEK